MVVSLGVKPERGRVREVQDRMSVSIIYWQEVAYGLSIGNKVDDREQPLIGIHGRYVALFYVLAFKVNHVELILSRPILFATKNATFRWRRIRTFDWYHNEWPWMTFLRGNDRRRALSLQ